MDEAGRASRARRRRRRWLRGSSEAMSMKRTIRVGHGECCCCVSAIDLICWSAGWAGRADTGEEELRKGGRVVVLVIVGKTATEPKQSVLKRVGCASEYGQVQVGGQVAIGLD